MTDNRSADRRLLVADPLSDLWLCPYHGNAYEAEKCVCCSLAVKRNRRESK